ncbi:MAG: TRAFs-binding domain-containing protein [Candidatus Omnitrophota bacterium]|jgi:tetratricopeptide (TPR) repeat protein
MADKKGDAMKKNCFVIMGYGIKHDYVSGRSLDLDKTFENIISPVCKALHLNCFRAKDIAINGVIDKPMYEWLYNADVVVADISTLNANALYELGVRHALRPFSTIVISEKELKRPFDVDHTVINPYEHLGADIGVTEARRFKKELKSKISAIINKPDTDSPVYTYLPALIPPKLKVTLKKKNAAPLEGYPSISELIKNAEDAKNKKDFGLAIKILSAARKYDENNHFILQRLALATYKSEHPNKLSSYRKAISILKELSPETTSDPETLGLCGAIFKRMHDETRRREDLERALYFYEKGFYLKQDYYNGLNVAYLYDQMASLAHRKEKAVYCMLHANITRDKVVKICEGLINKKNFSSRSDAEWIVQTIYQALLGNGLRTKAKKYLPLIKKYSAGDFDQDTFKEHVNKLLEFKKKTRKKYGLTY